jgi:hypothetical protein
MGRAYGVWRRPRGRPQAGHADHFRDHDAERVIDEKVSHYLGGHGKKMDAVAPVRLVLPGQPKERFVYQGRRLERVAGPFLLHVVLITLDPYQMTLTKK